MKSSKIVREIMWDGEQLHSRVDGRVATLGAINTRDGGLTRIQKLKAVQFTNEWVKV